MDKQRSITIEKYYNWVQFINFIVKLDVICIY